jgi:hypothetical protein
VQRSPSSTSLGQAKDTARRTEASQGGASTDEAPRFHGHVPLGGVVSRPSIGSDFGFPSRFVLWALGGKHREARCVKARHADLGWNNPLTGAPSVLDLNRQLRKI